MGAQEQQFAPVKNLCMTQSRATKLIKAYIREERKIIRKCVFVSDNCMKYARPTGVAH